MKNKTPLQWFVFYRSMYKDEITTFNVFDHLSFTKDITYALVSSKTKQDFAKERRRELMYYFWAKCEYEVIVSACPPNNIIPEIKIDVYQQIIINWDIFVDYIWNKKDSLCLFEEGLYYENP